MFLAQCIEYVLSCLYLFNELFFRERFSHPGIFGRDEKDGSLSNITSCYSLEVLFLGWYYYDFADCRHIIFDIMFSR